MTYFGILLVGGVFMLVVLVASLVRVIDQVSACLDAIHDLLMEGARERMPAQTSIEESLADAMRRKVSPWKPL